MSNSDHKSEPSQADVLAAQVRRYSLRGMPSLRFVRRPVAMPPADGTVCMVDTGTPDLADRYAGAIYRNGGWTNARGVPLKFVPTFWTAMATDE